MDEDEDEDDEDELLEEATLLDCGLLLEDIMLLE